jgi:hypothetical protein
MLRKPIFEGGWPKPMKRLLREIGYTLNELLAYEMADSCLHWLRR